MNWLGIISKINMIFINLKTFEVEKIKPNVPFVLCIGNFDGVHIGHQALITCAVQKKSELSDKYKNIKSGAWCFSELPLNYLSKNPPSFISDLDEKLKLFSYYGLDYAVVADFPSLKDISAEQFVKEILVGKCNCVFAVCGFNFRFACNGSGTPSLLSKFMDGKVEIVPEVVLNGNSVSSSLIRNAISAGEIEKANSLLGRPYSFELEIVHGKGLGKTLGIPTINQSFPKKMLVPAIGIYVTECEIKGKKYVAVSNIGKRPTFEESDVINCETYIIDFCGDIYGEKARISFLHRLRNEQKFDSEKSLLSQIEIDIKSAREYVKKNK